MLGEQGILLRVGWCDPDCVFGRVLLHVGWCDTRPVGWGEFCLVLSGVTLVLYATCRDVRSQ